MFQKQLKNILGGFLVFGLILGFQASAAQSADAGRMAAAKELLQSMNMDKLMGQMLPGILNQVKLQERRRSPNIPQAELDRVFDAISQTFSNRINGLIDKVAELYAESFTEEELRELAKFYQTPLGKKILQKTPVLMQRSMQVGQQWGLSLMPEIMKKKEELMRR